MDGMCHPVRNGAIPDFGFDPRAGIAFTNLTKKLVIMLMECAKNNTKDSIFFAGPGMCGIVGLT